MKPRQNSHSPTLSATLSARFSCWPAFSGGKTALKAGLSRRIATNKVITTVSIYDTIAITLSRRCRESQNSTPDHAFL